MRGKRPLILDLDGTLLHTDPSEGVVVPGRSRPAFLARAVIELLAELAQTHGLVLATGRSWAGTEIVVEALAAAGAPVAGLVLEDGAVWGRPGALNLVAPDRPWTRLRAAIPAPAGWPAYCWQEDFTGCLVARAEAAGEGPALAATLGAFGRSLDPTLRIYRDGRKVYLIGREADKWQSLVRLLGSDAARAAGIGDGGNDACWLRRVAQPLTFADAAPEARAAVQAVGGTVGGLRSHAGILGLLRQAPNERAEWTGEPGLTVRSV